MLEEYVPLAGGILGVLMVLSAYFTVRLKDLVYSSVSLALLGLFNAALLALLGYVLISVFLVVVYVGAAVMFIILSVSMLGGAMEETRDEVAGLFAGAAVGSSLFLLLVGTGMYKAYTRTAGVPVSRISELLATDYGVVLALIFVALAATLLEAISIARRG